MSNIISAEISRKDHAQRKSDIINLLEEAALFYQREEMDDKANAFAKLKEDLINGEFSIVVVGEFSSGKSTLLNALMRKRILPSFSSETTATVNFLRHIDKSESGEAGKVYYQNGEILNLEDASLDTVKKYVSTEGENVVQTVNHLDLYLDSDFLKDGVTLVDSPGLNGVLDGHRQITEQQILKSHASIFLFSCDHPGSKTDFEFLYDLHRKVKTIIFVLNKIDDIKADEGETVESVIKTLKDNYKKQFPDEETVPEIWPLAAYPALVARNDAPLEYHGITERSDEENRELEKFSRLEDFENRLFTFLTRGEKTKNQLVAPVERVISVAKESKQQYEENKNMLLSSIDAADLENEIAKIGEVIEELKKQTNSGRQQISREVETALTEIREELSAQMSKYAERTIREIDMHDDLEQLYDYLQTFENKYIKKVISLTTEADDNLKKKIQDIIQIGYINQSVIIGSKFDELNSKIEIKVSEHIDTKEHFFKVGLKEMDEKRKLLESDLERLKREAEKVQGDVIKARRSLRKRERLESNIEMIENERRIIRDQTLPAVETYYEDVVVRKKRGGFFGSIADFFDGGKLVHKQELITDPTGRDEAIARQNKEIKEMNSKIEQIKAQLPEDADIDEYSIYQLDEMHTKKEAEITDMRDRIRELIESDTKKIEESYRKEIRRIKQGLRDFCDYESEELLKQASRGLKANKDSYVFLIAEAIQGSTKNDLKAKQERIEQLIEQKKFSEEDRNTRIAALDVKIEAVSGLLAKAFELETDLENIEIDIIKNVAL